MPVTYWVCIAGWLTGWWAFGRAMTLPVGEPHRSSRGRTTVVVPARNEAASLDRLLSDLQREAAGDDVAVVVVDDSSEDDTAAIAQGFDGVELVSAPPLPPGWAGKCWACDRGTATRRGGDELLVLLDADVRLHPGALDALRDAHRHHGGLLSVQPYHDTVRPYEQLSALFNVIALMGVGAGTDSPSGAFGPVLVTDRVDYDAVGGHAAVRGEVVEDLALARRYREAGLPVSVRTGGELISFRMYPTGLRDLIDGWTKNFALGAGATPLLRLAAIVLWITAVGTSGVALLEAALGRTDAVPALAAYLLVAAQLVVMFRRVGRFGVLTALVHPLLVTTFVAVFVRSLWRTHVRRSVAWRGRLIATTPHTTPRRP